MSFPSEKISFSMSKSHRDLARRFNSTFGETFVVPEPFVVKEGMRIMGLDDPAKKMSKSAFERIQLHRSHRSPEKIREKIINAVTDSGKTIRYSDDQPAIKNLINIYALLDNAKPQELRPPIAKKAMRNSKRILLK